MPKYYLEHYGFVGDDENYLMHYGVKGMKWRHRKALSKDPRKKMNSYRLNGSNSLIGGEYVPSRTNYSKERPDLNEIMDDSYAYLNKPGSGNGYAQGTLSEEEWAERRRRMNYLNNEFGRYGFTAYTSPGHQNNNGGRYGVQSSVYYNGPRGKNKKRR